MTLSLVEAFPILRALLPNVLIKNTGAHPLWGLFLTYSGYFTLKLYQKGYPEKDTAPPVKDKYGSVVQWLALWTLNPEIRVQVSAEPTPWVYVSL